MVVDFDAADAAWLTGYTDVLDGAVSLLCAYDWMPVWDQFAHVLFRNSDPKPPFAAIEVPRGPGTFGFLPHLVAAIHEMRLQLIDRSGPAKARDSFVAMIASSRTCWKRALKETDSGREWLPPPSQVGPRGTEVNREQINGWFKVLDELEAVAAGRKLLAHWRIQPGNGINVPRLVENPPPLDLVMWVHGGAMIPYVEKGEVSDAQSWNRLREPFGPGFFRFAIWSN